MTTINLNSSAQRSKNTLCTIVDAELMRKEEVDAAAPLMLSGESYKANNFGPSLNFESSLTLGVLGRSGTIPHEFFFVGYEGMMELDLRFLL